MRMFKVVGLALMLCLGISACDRAPESTAQEGDKPAPAAARGADMDAQAVKVPLTGARLKGSEEALVTIVEFSDYACPFCKKAHETVEALVGKYNGRVRLAVFENPLPFHEVAAPAAKWAYAAGAQGKYWQARDLLFERQKDLGEEALAGMAKELGLDPEKLDADRRSLDAERYVKTGLDLGATLGVKGTPTFFVNGRRLIGAQPADKFSAVIDAAVKEAEAMVARGVPRRQVYAEIMKTAASPAAKEAGAKAGGNEPCGGGEGCQGNCEDAPAAADEAAVKVDVDIAGAPSRGAADAPVTIVVFTDFECPFCRKAEATLRALEGQYKGKLRIAYRSYPLKFHDNARPAARAALAAHRQGKFFEYRDALFEHQGALGREALLAQAAAVGLDVKRFEADMDSEAVEAAVAADVAQVEKLDIQGTPTFFVNGRRLIGAQPEEAFRKAIDRALSER